MFTNAYYEHFPTVTAVGHSVFMSGAMPSVSGIIGNDWYDRGTGKRVTSIGDDSVKILGGAGEGGASPNRLLVSTVGDELKAATGGKSRVIGISMKDRAAILPAGHAADAAYWFDSGTGKFVSSTFYLPDLPAWVKDFNLHSTEKYEGAEWVGGKLPSGAKLFPAIVSSPFGNDLLESFAERAIQAENLGKDDVPDLLTVSFSSNDYVGHDFGPDSAEVRATCLATDEVLGRLLRFLDSSVGLNNVLVVLAADHGVAPTPEANAARHSPAGRMPPIIQSTVQAELAKKYGDGKWILSSSEHTLYLNLDLIREKKQARADVEETVRELVLALPHVFRVYTRTQLINGSIVSDRIGRRVANGFSQVRGGDVYLLLEPFWLYGTIGTTHGSAFNYDSHVPVIFMGPWVRPGIYDGNIAPNDIAPTLATILGIEIPNGADGRALTEIILRPGK
jgi:predicted AlkP superfamily pyrophosphatase or phosphodiesterase